MTEGRVRSLLEAATPGPWVANAYSAPLETGGDSWISHPGGEVSDRVFRAADAALIAAAPDLARACLEACAERDAAYAQGALDMRTRAAVSVRDRADGWPSARERGVLDEAADHIEALNVEVPQ